MCKREACCEAREGVLSYASRRPHDPNQCNKFRLEMLDGFGALQIECSPARAAGRTCITISP